MAEYPELDERVESYLAQKTREINEWAIREKARRLDEAMQPILRGPITGIRQVFGEREI